MPDYNNNGVQIDANGHILGASWGWVIMVEDRSGSYLLDDKVHSFDEATSTVKRFNEVAEQINHLAGTRWLNFTALALIQPEMKT